MILRDNLVKNLKPVTVESNIVILGANIAASFLESILEALASDICFLDGKNYETLYLSANCALHELRENQQYFPELSISDFINSQQNLNLNFENLTVSNETLKDILNFVLDLENVKMIKESATPLFKLSKELPEASAPLVETVKTLVSKFKQQRATTAEEPTPTKNEQTEELTKLKSKKDIIAFHHARPADPIEEISE